jgi:hypothetical protein
MSMLLCGVLVASCSGARDASDSARSSATSGVATTEQTAAPSSAAAATTQATRAPQRQVTITAFGFGLPTGTFTIGSLGYGFTIRNENTAEAAESVSIQIAFQDAAGTVVATDNTSISYLGPGEHTGVAGSSFASTAKTATKMTVQALPSKWTVIGPVPNFTFTGTAYLAEQFSTKVTGIIKSPFAKDYKLVRVSAIGVNAAGAIVGGGYAFVDFVPANGTAAVSISYTGTTPANVALYGQLSSLSLLSTP